MDFVQLVEFSTSNIDDVDRALTEYRAKREAAGAPMPVEVLQCKDRDAANRYVAIVRFPSYEAAMENSNHPDTSALAETMRGLCDAPTVFRNLDLLEQFKS